MTSSQREELRWWLTLASELHHGDCIGSDKQAHEIGMEMGVTIYKHPPKNPKYRAYCEGGIELPAKPYIPRNADIVRAGEILIAAPPVLREVRSGTWGTIKLARRAHRPYVILFP